MKTGSDIYQHVAGFIDLPGKIATLGNGKLRKLMIHLGSLDGDLPERESQVLAAAICVAAARFMRGRRKGKGRKP